MGKGQRFTEEFRVEAVRQVTERGFRSIHLDIYSKIAI
jgi:transposase-like protein